MIADKPDPDLTFIKDIRTYYDKINSEISSLKSIILDRKQVKKHTMTEKVP